MSKIVLLELLLLVVTVCCYEADRILELPLYGQLKSKNYAGYVPLPSGQKAFYWFIESEGSPSSDPLVQWLNGGPGCSSLMGALSENGPYTIRHGGNFFDNEFRWTKYANMLYMESPPGVGFSIDVSPPTTWNDTNTAQANYDFLLGWFKKFPQYRANSFFLGGESYAGHYVPQLADRILTGTDAELRKKMKGFMVGNPCTGNEECNQPETPPGLHDYLMYHGFRPLNKSIPIAEAIYDPTDILVADCPGMMLTKMVRWSNPAVDKLRQKLRDAPVPYGPCADLFMIDWANRADVKAALHVNDSSVYWEACNMNPNFKYEFNKHGVLELYEKFFKQTEWSMMIYSGTADTVVNFVATQMVVNSFKRPLKNPKFTPWYYPYVYNASIKQLGGFYLEFDRISWAGVRDAGHMVPQQNPPEALELFRSFITLGRPGRL